MTGDEAREVMATWGNCRPFRRHAERYESLVVDRVATSVFAYFDDAGLVEAVELSSPGHGVLGEDEVCFEGLDVFVAPAGEVIRQVGERGLTVIDVEAGHSSVIPQVLLALWRDGEPFDDAVNLPMYFESALIARPGYYDRS